MAELPKQQLIEQEEFSQEQQKPPNVTTPAVVPVAQNVPTTLFTKSGEPVQVYPAGFGTVIYPNHKEKPSKVLGCLQITFGLLIVLCQIILTAMRAQGNDGMAGLLASIVFILAGAFGIQSAKTKSRCTVLTTMILSIIGAVVAFALLYQPVYGMIYGFPMVNVVFNIIIMVFIILEFFVAIIAAAFCCQGSCGSNQAVVITSDAAQGAIGTQPVGVVYNQQHSDKTVVGTVDAVGTETWSDQASGPVNLPPYDPKDAPPDYSEKV